MARLFYMSLPGVGRWDVTMKQVGAQLRPYSDFLWTAKTAAQARKPVLTWRAATKAEAREFQTRLDERWDQQARKARRSSKRRDRHVRQKPAGVWVVLEPPPWQPEEPDDTFDAFLDAKSVHEDPRCGRNAEVVRLDYDREGRALLLDRLPESYRPADLEDEPPPPTAAKPHGDLIWLRPNTYTLERQIYALRDLDNAPSPRLAPLIRLVSTHAQWPDVEPAPLDEDAWHFLKRGQDGGLRDGTDEQRRFVAIALGTQDFAVLEGPPGSGKTTAICELIVQLLQQEKRVLLVASTHVAVDNVLERLIAWQDGLTDEQKLVLPVRVGEEDRVTSDAIVPFTLKRIRQTWRDELGDFFDSPGDVSPEGAAARRMLKEALGKAGKEMESPLMRLILDSSNLICGTTIGILQHPAIKQANRGGDGFEPFDVMILDEASKTTFSEFLVPALHARRWVVVGDIKQLSPYVEEVDLSENIRGLVPPTNARAAAHAFTASLNGPRQVRSLLALGEGEAEIASAEASARDARFVVLDGVQAATLRGVSRAVPELLYADLVMGSASAIQSFEHRLPADLLVEGGDVPALLDWRAARRAVVVSERKQKRYVDLSEDVDWASEVAWRLVRSYELRQNAAEKRRYVEEVGGLLPVTLDTSWFEWRKSRPRKNRENGDFESPREALERELGTMRRVAMPSILELLQTGFERLPGWDQGVALTDGLPPDALAQRLVSLTFQHRMHSHISAFPRQQFYTSTTGAELGEEHRRWLDMYGTEYRHDQDFVLSPVILGPLERARKAFREQQTAALLRDAAGLDAARSWTYNRYARRALWLEVDPGRRRSGRKNSSLAEARKVLEELRAFVDWAAANPRRDEHGAPKPWEVAVLTFYRGQEALLRDDLKRESGQFGNTRNFRLPKGAATPAVTVTLCTVDRFQGHEADLVLLSFVKSGSVGFLNSPNRLNVALTRARYQLVLVGHRSYFASDRCRSPLLRSLADSKFYHGDIGWEVEA
ncbi:MAG: AAA family ATPase [Sandaracinaceae bacterium]|nr:AAA family ATPase [Sandaracinaceae bacterium]